MNRRSFLSSLLAAPVALKAAFSRPVGFVSGRWFRNFGAGSPKVLHGAEAVIPASMAGDYYRNALQPAIEQFEADWEAAYSTPTCRPLREGTRR